MRAVVSFANTQFYQDKMKRLQESVEKQNIKFIGFTSFEEVECRPHAEIPYQFKPYAIQKAIDMGVTTLLWCDSPIVAIKDLSPVFDYIEKYGYMFFDNIGHPLGNWTNQKALDHFEMSREEAMKVKQIMACCMGFSFNPLHGHAFFVRELIFRIYKNLSNELYPGSWDDHRHDQTVMSFLINRNNLDILTAHETYFAYEHFYEVFKVSDSVSLISK